MKISGYMHKFQDLTPISGQISKCPEFQEFQDNAQACTHTVNVMVNRPTVPQSSLVYHQHQAHSAAETEKLLS